MVICALRSGTLLLFSVFKEPSGLKIEQVQTSEQGYQEIHAITQLNKNGRVFYGGSEGHVKELVFEDLTQTWTQLLVHKTKRMLTTDH